jgi:hypothetical protein
MFTSWSPSTPNGSAAASGSPPSSDGPDRSRTPTPLAASSNFSGGPALASVSPENQSVTGNRIADEWFANSVRDPDIKVKFMTLPLYRRKGIVLKAMERPPENPESWMLACIRNFGLQQLETRLTGEASVHARPNPNQFGPPIPAWNGGLAAPVVYSGSYAPVGSAGAGGGGVAMQSAVVATSSSPGPVPSWAPELYACWPHQKSSLLGKFLALLNGDVQSRVLVLAPPTQAALAFALVVAGTSGQPQPDVLVSQWLSRIENMNGTTPSAAMPSEAAASSHSKFKLQIIITGESAPLSVMTTKAFHRVMASVRSDVQWDFLPLVCIADGDPAGAIAMDAGQRLRVEVNSSVHDFNQLSQFFTANSSDFKSQFTKFFFVNLVSTQAFENGSSTTATVSDLHGIGTRWLWSLVKLSHDLRAVVGDNNVAELTLTPSLASTTVVSSLAHLFGPLVIASRMHSEYNKVAPLPLAFGVPSDFTITKCHDEQDTAATLMDGWSMVAPPTERSAPLLPGLIGGIGRALESQIFQERTLTPAETGALTTYKLKHTATGEERYCSRDWWMRWWGYHQTPHQKFLDETQPCSRTIISVSGLPAPETSPCAKPCGRDRYCKVCESVFNGLDKTFALPTVIDCMVAIMNKALKTWKHGEGAGEWSRVTCVDRSHTCGADCSLRV